MYVQITTRCNMTCAHCCFNCTAVGEDMSLDTFALVLQKAGRHLTIGGGEPTIHPKFWKFLQLAIDSPASIGLVTNGSMTDIAIELAKMARKGTLAVVLSQDMYHDSIDPRVVAAFKDAPRQVAYPHIAYSDDYRIVRDVTLGLINNGRCDFGADGCCCTGTLIEPSGIVRHCGCDDAPSIGSVQEGFDLSDSCHRRAR